MRRKNLKAERELDLIAWATARAQLPTLKDMAAKYDVTPKTMDTLLRRLRLRGAVPWRQRATL